MMRNRFFRALPWLSLALTLAGCGGANRPAMGYVSGTITIDNQPYPMLLVTVQPESGRAAIGTTDSKGYYDVEYTRGEKGAKVGPSTITFSWPTGYSAPKGIPQKYVAPSKEIQFEVKKGRNKFDFNIETAADANKAPQKPIAD